MAAAHANDYKSTNTDKLQVGGPPILLIPFKTTTTCRYCDRRGYYRRRTFDKKMTSLVVSPRDFR